MKSNEIYNVILYISFMTRLSFMPLSYDKINEVVVLHFVGEERFFRKTMEVEK